MIEREVTLDQLTKLFGMDYTTPEVLDLVDMGLLVESANENNGVEYKEIDEFLVKPSVKNHYRLGDLYGTAKHRVKVGDEYVALENHPEAILINTPLDVVDMVVRDNENYIANGQVNHNTTSGGKCLLPL